MKALVGQRSPLAALQVFHAELGSAFAIALPGFRATILAGHDANHQLLVKERESFRWRNEDDPVTRLLRHGVLVEDGEAHAALRRVMSPALHRAMLGNYVEAMWRSTDQVTDAWGAASSGGAEIDLLVEMRRIALLILTRALFSVDFTRDMAELWQPILKAIRYISPGPWMLWRGVPRPGYRRALSQLDAWLYQLIADRRAAATAGDDLLGGLIDAGMSDALIRDQLLTLLIAGHDTSTALLSWAFCLLTAHPDVMLRVRDEVDRVLGSQAPTLAHMVPLEYTEQVLKETLRLYPPIHLGSRTAVEDVDYQGRVIPAGMRVLYSIYLTQRNKRDWPDPHRFDPDRFLPAHAHKLDPYTYLPFGGGPRNCIGMAFAQVEAKVVLARVLQKYDLAFVRGAVRPHMGATLEPYPGVILRATQRRSG
ncbi:MAG TPA: cytochrome P450 [Anaerolineae bacterium]